MKGLFSYVGWLLFLGTAALGLIIYNAVHVPVLRREARQQEEIRLWTGELESLRDSLDRRTVSAETSFAAVFSFDELFGSDETFAVSAGGENTLRGIVTMLQQSTGTITVTGHTDSGTLPARVRSSYPSHWHYGSAAAVAVASGLKEWGIAAERLRVASPGAAVPRDDNTSPEGRARNRRIEILVLNDR